LAINPSPYDRPAHRDAVDLAAGEPDARPWRNLNTVLAEFLRGVAKRAGVQDWAGVGRRRQENGKVRKSPARMLDVMQIPVISTEMMDVSVGDP
jgi:hypothetical protein